MIYGGRGVEGEWERRGRRRRKEETKKRQHIHPQAKIAMAIL